MDMIMRNLIDDSDEEGLLNIACIYLNFEYNTLLKPKPQPQRTSKLTGHEWVVEKLNSHQMNCYETFRMTPSQFIKFCELLKERKNLKDTRFVTVQEQVAIFLLIICQTVRTRFSGDRFQHSVETIHRHFKRVLKVVCSLSKDFLIAPSFDETAPEIRFNPRYYPFFKELLMAPIFQHARKLEPTMNVMCCCSFDMKFTFAMVGWEGTANDSRVFLETIHNAENHFPIPPEGKYYLVDSGYANMPGFLSPYRGERYRLRDYRGQREPQGPEELFNYMHSSLRNVIERCFERCFGVLKARFPILKSMLPYAVKRQKYIPLACCVVHNFIKIDVQDDPLFRRYVDENVELEAEETNQNHVRDEYVLPQVTTADIRRMNAFQDRRLWNATHRI